MIHNHQNKRNIAVSLACADVDCTSVLYVS
jgi:hypothetical protein